ncbi:enoyl-CoA hydratase/isomerase family protein [Chitinimonas lacunae]|uniref:Enoyl-CoA hydratase/isomerase family protein n=1 Tax=Chitinimonas lacunae TaxID=1963018 RepID=A0ABV8MX43_9NEIS
MSPCLLVETATNGVATLLLNRPERHNAFDDVLIVALTEALQKLDADPAVRVVVLAAQGKNFSAGADLGWMQRMAGYAEADNLADARKLAQLMETLDRLSKPVIGAAQGATFGGGVGLIACCDLVVASNDAQFCLSEVKLGLIPAVISPYVVRKIGVAAARRYFLTAERFSASEAQRFGLVHELAPADELPSLSHALAEHLLANGPQALAAAKRLIHDIADRPIDAELIDDTARRIAAIRVGAEGQEGLKAFLEKRPPNWIKPR